MARNDRSTIVVLGAALFAMFFGASNLLFPPELGHTFGTAYLWSMLGFLLTGAGLPLLAVLAVAKAGGGLDEFAARVDPRFGRALTIVLILAIGPLFAIPRSCVTTYDLVISPTIPSVGPWLFAALYFGAVLIIALRPLTALDRIGGILAPVLLGALALLIVKGILQPMGSPAPTGQVHAFSRSLIEGFRTMDLLAASIFGIVLLNDIRSRGVGSHRRQVTIIAKAGCIAAATLAAVYAGLILLGATTAPSALLPSRTQLLVFIAERLVGSEGRIVLGIAVSMACLTTAIGLTVVCAEYVSRLTRGAVGYAIVCIATAAAGFAVANFGFDAVVRISLPVLIALYPVVVTLVLLCLGDQFISNPNAWRGAVLGSLLAGIAEALSHLQILPAPLERLREGLPLVGAGFGWLLPTVILGIAGAFLPPRARRRFRLLVVTAAERATRLAISEEFVPLSELTIPHRLEQWATAESRAALTQQIATAFAAHLAKERLDGSTIAAVVARGGLAQPLPSGAYRITEQLRRGIEEGWRGHPSNWAAAIAHEIASAHGFLPLLIDPIALDEMEEVAHFTGLPEIRRMGRSFAAAQRAALRHLAKMRWIKPHRISAIVALLGGEASIAAYRGGRAVDVTDALQGEGPFSGFNAGALPAADVVRLCFTPGATMDAVLARLRQEGGLNAYLATADAAELNARLKGQDAWTADVVEAMGYAAARAIGAQVAVLGGRIDAIALTGPLTACDFLVHAIASRVTHLGPVVVVPETVESEELLERALRVLRGRERPLDYNGAAV